MKKVLYLFSRLTDADVDWLAQHGAVEVHADGETLIAEGEEGTGIFIALEGNLSVGSSSGGVLAQLESGEIVGEMSLIDSRPASATVKAVGECRVLRLPRTMVEDRLDRDVAFAARFFRATSVTLSERLRSTNLRGVPDVADELSPALLSHLHLAGARFDRLLKSVSAR
jgi:CRP-like cAMP-binding protein